MRFGLWVGLGVAASAAALSSCSNTCPEGTRLSYLGCRQDGQEFYLSWSIPTVHDPEVHYPKHLKVGPPP